jgi:hypothetical protein
VAADQCRPVRARLWVLGFVWTFVAASGCASCSLTDDLQSCLSVARKLDPNAVDVGIRQGTEAGSDGTESFALRADGTGVMRLGNLDGCVFSPGIFLYNRARSEQQRRDSYARWAHQTPVELTHPRIPTPPPDAAQHAVPLVDVPSVVIGVNDYTTSEGTAGIRSYHVTPEKQGPPATHRGAPPPDVESVAITIRDNHRDQLWYLSGYDVLLHVPKGVDGDFYVPVDQFPTVTLVSVTTGDVAAVILFTTWPMNVARNTRSRGGSPAPRSAGLRSSHQSAVSPAMTDLNSSALTPELSSVYSPQGR